jgi:hypothetical protein
LAVSNGVSAFSDTFSDEQDLYVQEIPTTTIRIPGVGFTNETSPIQEVVVDYSQPRDDRDEAFNSGGADFNPNLLSEPNLPIV